MPPERVDDQSLAALRGVGPRVLERLRVLGIETVVVLATVYLSGQIALEPRSMELVEGIRDQVHQVFKNLRCVSQAAGGDFDCIVKLTIYLTDMTNFPTVNEVMSEYFGEPYPARAAVGVASLPKGAAVEVEGVMVLPD